MNFNPVRKTICAQCPYARATSKEYLDTRGYNGDRFAAQAIMNALLPCHMDDPEGEGMARVESSNRQCAGAAIYRSNVGATEHLSPLLASLPMDNEKVFDNHLELIAHHRGCTIEEAEAHVAACGGLIAMRAHEARLAAELGRVEFHPSR